MAAWRPTPAVCRCGAPGRCLGPKAPTPDVARDIIQIVPCVRSSDPRTTWTFWCDLDASDTRVTRSRAWSGFNRVEVRVLFGASQESRARRGFLHVWASSRSGGGGGAGAGALRAGVLPLACFRRTRAATARARGGGGRGRSAEPVRGSPDYSFGRRVTVPSASKKTTRNRAAAASTTIPTTIAMR
jgi:hypothetical protein